MHHTVVITADQLRLLEEAERHEEIITPQEIAQLIKDEADLRRALDAHEKDRFAVTHHPQLFE